MSCAIAGALGFPLAAGAQTGSTPPPTPTPTPTAASPSTATPAQPRKPLAYVNVALATSQGEDEFDDPAVGLVRVGTAFARGGIGQYFAVEAELGTGFGSKSETFEDPFVRGRFENEVDNMVALVGVARIPLRGRGHVFLRTGWASHSRTSVAEGEFLPFDTELPPESFRDDFSQTISGFAFGIGAEGFFGRERRNGIRVDSFAVGEDSDSFDSRGDPLVDVSVYASIAYVRRF